MDGLLVFLSVVISLILSKVIKLFFFKDSKKALFSGGGMPSSHLASVTSLSTMIFLLEGFSTTFVLSFAFNFIVFVDAIRVRRAVGINADTLKILVNKKSDDVMVEHGHTIKEAVYGSILGFSISTIIFILVML